LGLNVHTQASRWSGGKLEVIGAEGSGEYGENASRREGDEEYEEYAGFAEDFDEHGIPSRPRAIVWRGQIYEPVPSTGPQHIPAPHVSYCTDMLGEGSDVETEGPVANPPGRPAEKEDDGSISGASEAEHARDLSAAHRQLQELTVLLEKETQIRSLLEKVASLAAENSGLKAEAMEMEESLGRIHSRVAREEERRRLRKRADETI
jgi:hypothetical protein